MPEEYYERYYNEETRLTSFVIEYDWPRCQVVIFNSEGQRLRVPIVTRTFEQACQIAQDRILP
jgi:hypothetical protein